MAKTTRRSPYRVVRNEQRTTWLIIDRDGRVFTTRDTRREAMECARQWQALDEELNRSQEEDDGQDN